jgi:hypothetical protein
MIKKTIGIKVMESISIAGLKKIKENLQQEGNQKIEIKKIYLLEIIFISKLTKRVVPNFMRKR